VTIDLNKWPRTGDGAPITATTFEDTFGLAPQWVGDYETANNGATNIFDVLVTTEKRLRGGWYEIMDDNAVIGDYIEFSVVDKDDVLGLFEILEIPEGGFLELRKYVEKDYVNPKAAGIRQTFVGNSAFPVIAGLYLRATYVSTGSNDVIFKYNTWTYE